MPVTINPADVFVAIGRKFRGIFMSWNTVSDVDVRQIELQIECQFDTVRQLYLILSGVFLDSPDECVRIFLPDIFQNRLRYCT